MALPSSSSPFTLDGTNLGTELTFIPRFPRSRWQEWRRKEDATEATRAFNRALVKDPRIKAFEKYLGHSPSFLGKADIFRSVPLSSDPQPHDSWCLEVNNHPFLLSNVTDCGPKTIEALRAVYDTAASLDLHPYIERRKRDGTTIQFPTGGGHLHLSLNFWSEGVQYLGKLYHLEQAMCVSYANHPEIRWLFSQWFDNLNSRVAVDLTEARAIEGYQKRGLLDGPNGRTLTTLVHERALTCHSIKQRIADTGKPHRPTYEFRFFDMPRSVSELVLQAQFLEAWVGYWVNRVDALTPLSDEETGNVATLRADWDRDIRYTLTPRRYRRLVRDLPYARAQVEAFFREIRLDPEPYMALFYQRNYVPRMEHGEAL